MAENSFDVVSKVDLQEVANAIQNAIKEVHTRFDLKDSKSNIEIEKDAIMLHSADEYKLKAVNDVLQAKLVKRGVNLKAIDYGKVEPAAPGAHDAEAYVERAPDDAARAGVRARRGPPPTRVSLDELVAKGHTVLDRVESLVRRVAGRVGNRLGRSGRRSG